MLPYITSFYTIQAAIFRPLQGGLLIEHHILACTCADVSVNIPEQVARVGSEFVSRETCLEWTLCHPIYIYIFVWVRLYCRPFALVPPLIIPFFYAQPWSTIQPLPGAKVHLQTSIGWGHNLPHTATIFATWHLSILLTGPPKCLCSQIDVLARKWGGQEESIKRKE